MLVVALLARRARADDWELGAGAESNAQSRFTWRGAAFSRGPVAQPSAWGAAMGLTAEVFCNFMLMRESREQPSAIVGSVVREFAWRSLRIAPGFFLYDLPRARAPSRTEEASVDASIDLGELSLTTTHALDVGSHPRAYFGTAGLAIEPDVGPFTIVLTTDIGWATAELNREYFHRGASGLSVAEAKVAARYELSDLLYFVLHAEGSTLLSQALRASGAEPTLATAGATVGFEL